MKINIENRFLETTFLCLVFMGILSCEERWEKDELENSPPSLVLKQNNQQYWLDYSDTMKMSQKAGKSHYSINLKPVDDNLSGVGFEIVSGKGKITQKDQLFATTEGSLALEDSIVQIRYIPESIGKHEILFKAHDVLGEEASLMLNLEVFANQPPVAGFSLNFKGAFADNPGHYELDGSASFDQDKKWGGEVSLYEFSIGDFQIETPQSKVDFFFQKEGNYEIKLRVMDNDGDWSEEISDFYEVKF
ncbi:hypothetical protein [Flexithrix dorotheae]|uniref:hypothetical protein n=1 Tax=Flexithrix dorotheae TaxID=70993 RepID=UPI0012FB1CCD|nr:hypothetical protein [Flexithrix dorotheae]